MGFEDQASFAVLLPFSGGPWGFMELTELQGRQDDIEVSGGREEWDK